MKLQAILAVFASLVIATCAITIADVLADIATRSTKLERSVAAFSTNSGVFAALGLGKDVYSLISAIDQGKSVAISVPKPIAESDANNILKEAQNFEPAILQALSTVISKKSVFVALPIPGVTAVVKKILTALNASASGFEAALIAAAPANLLPQTKSIKASIDDALARAISAYS